MKRTTIILTDELKANIECLSQVSGESQGKIIRDAIRMYLKSKKMQPNKTPKLTFTYTQNDERLNY